MESAGRRSIRLVRPCFEPRTCTGLRHVRLFSEVSDYSNILVQDRFQQLTPEEEQDELVGQLMNESTDVMPVE